MLRIGTNQDVRKIIRIRYETAFLGDKMTRLDIGSYVGGNRVSINNSLMCQPPDFVDVEVPIQQDQLCVKEAPLANGADMISDVELKAVRSKIGIKGISVVVEAVREPYEGSLEKLTSNFM